MLQFYEVGLKKLSEYLNHRNNKQSSGLKFSLSILAIVAISAVIWVIFLADDGTENDFISTPTDIAADGTGTAQNAIPQAQPVIVPTFDVVRISRNGTGVIAGSAEPNSDVAIFAKDQQIGSAIADRNGEWVLLFDEPLPVGPTELSVISKTQSDIEITSNDIVIVAVPDRNSVDFNLDETDGVVAILSPRTGVGSSRILQRPDNVNLTSATRGLSLSTMDYTDDGNPVLSGNAEAGANIRLYLDNEYLGEVISGDDGTWSYQINQKLSAREYVLRLDQLLLDGNVEVRISQPFNPFVELDTARATGDVIVKPGNSLWHIARKLYGSGYHYTVIFGANMDSIVDPDLIYPGQQLNLPLDNLQ